MSLTGDYTKDLKQLQDAVDAIAKFDNAKRELDQTQQDRDEITGVVEKVKVFDTDDLKTKVISHRLARVPTWAIIVNGGKYVVEGYPIDLDKWSTQSIRMHLLCGAMPNNTFDHIYVAVG